MVMTGEDADAVGAKDPFVVIVGRRYFMFVHHAPRHLIPSDATDDELHGTGNVFATEKGKGGAGLAVSDDGVEFEWLGDVLLPGRPGEKATYGRPVLSNARGVVTEQRLFRDVYNYAGVRMYVSWEGRCNRDYRALLDVIGAEEAGLMLGRRSSVL